MVGAFLYLRALRFPVEQLKWHTFQLSAINFVAHTGYRLRLVSYGTMDQIRKLLFEAESVNGAVSGNYIFTTFWMVTIKKKRSLHPVSAMQLSSDSVASGGPAYPVPNVVDRVEQPYHNSHPCQTSHFSPQNSCLIVSWLLRAIKSFIVVISPGKKKKYKKLQ